MHNTVTTELSQHSNLPKKKGGTTQGITGVLDIETQMGYGQETVTRKDKLLALDALNQDITTSTAKLAAGSGTYGCLM